MTSLMNAVGIAAQRWIAIVETAMHVIGGMMTTSTDIRINEVYSYIEYVRKPERQYYIKVKNIYENHGSTFVQGIKYEDPAMREEDYCGWKDIPTEHLIEKVDVRNVE